MGEKIKILSGANLLHKKFVIELNSPTVKGQDEQIHIQSENIRFEIDKKHYIKYALSVLLAEKNLKYLKGIF